MANPPIKSSTASTFHSVLLTRYHPCLVDGMDTSEKVAGVFAGVIRSTLASLTRRSRKFTWRCGCLGLLYKRIVVQVSQAYGQSWPERQGQGYLHSVYPVALPSSCLSGSGTSALPSNMGGCVDVLGAYQPGL